MKENFVSSIFNRIFEEEKNLSELDLKISEIHRFYLENYSTWILKWIFVKHYKILSNLVLIIILNKVNNNILNKK